MRILKIRGENVTSRFYHNVSHIHQSQGLLFDFLKSIQKLTLLTQMYRNTHVYSVQLSWRLFEYQDLYLSVIICLMAKMVLMKTIRPTIPTFLAPTPTPGVCQGVHGSGFLSLYAKVSILSKVLIMSRNSASVYIIIKRSNYATART